MEKQILLIITWRKHNPPTIFNQLGLVFDWSISVAPNGCRKRTRCGTFLGCIALIIKERRSAIADILKKRAEHVAHQVWDLHAFTGNKESNLENEWINYIMNACMHASIHPSNGMEWNGMEWNEMKGIHDTQMHIGAMAKTCYVACGHPSFSGNSHMD